MFEKLAEIEIPNLWLSKKLNEEFFKKQRL